MSDKQLAKKGKSGVDNTFRRTWDKESYSERAAKREKEVQVQKFVDCVCARRTSRTVLFYRRRMLRRVLWMPKSDAG